MMNSKKRAILWGAASAALCLLFMYFGFLFGKRESTVQSTSVGDGADPFPVIGSAKSSPLYLNGTTFFETSKLDLGKVLPLEVSPNPRLLDISDAVGDNADIWKLPVHFRSRKDVLSWFGNNIRDETPVQFQSGNRSVLVAQLNRGSGSRFITLIGYSRAASSDVYGISFLINTGSKGLRLFISADKEWVLVMSAEGRPMALLSKSALDWGHAPAESVPREGKIFSVPAK